jgi:hypothetical protein
MLINILGMNATKKNYTFKINLTFVATLALGS